ncbi:hypothetical protein AB0L13_40310 [Saccharopolyspora shandongensis]|uniref:hypothetical protein n=1 Tax=Saccharopolyspora shandongensis TaxID=418495 RepID=UPI0034442E57
MNTEQHTKLREPFPTEVIGNKPKITCRACSKADGRVCDKHSAIRCDTCGNFITSAHIHLEFVGHADLTDRLLSVDPEWNWEPVAFDAAGRPALDDNNGLWIRLTVCGTTRLGYGHPDGKRGGDAVKETIGDALRNAAMRFGVALDLWKKEPHIEPAAEPPASPASKARSQLAEQCKAAGLDLDAVAAEYHARTKVALGEETNVESIRTFAAALASNPSAVLGTKGGDA